MIQNDPAVIEWLEAHPQQFNHDDDCRPPFFKLFEHVEFTMKSGRVLLLQRELHRMYVVPIEDVPEWHGWVALYD